MSKPAIIQRDLGWKRIRKQVEQLGKIEARAGILADKGSRNAAGPTNIEIGVWNEFGVEPSETHPGIPSRPFMRHTADKNRKKVGVLGEGFLKKIIDGQIEPNAALTRIAMWFSAEIQKEISASASWAEPNAPSTIAAKGSSTPLIDTGQLRQSINYVVQRKGSS